MTYAGALLQRYTDVVDKVLKHKCCPPCSNAVHTTRNSTTVIVTLTPFTCSV